MAIALFQISLIGTLLLIIKVTKAGALRRSQIALLRKYPNYSYPGYWAAYILVGNWL